MLKEFAGNDMVQQFSGYTAGSWVIKGRQYIPSSQKGQGPTFIVLMNNYSINGAMGLGARLKFDMNTTDGATPPVTIGSVSDVEDGGNLTPIIFDAWVDIRVEINLEANYRATYYNNTLVGVARWYNPADALSGQVSLGH